MRHFMRFHTLDGAATAIGFHKGHVPNRPASHGCIRLPGRSASELFRVIPRGTPVFVYGEAHGLPPRPLPVAGDPATTPPAKRPKKSRRGIRS
jgi:hypothetical protein